MKTLIQSLFLCALSPLWAAVASGAAGQTNAPTTGGASALFADTVVAKGKGVEVKRSEIENEVVNTRAMAAARGMSPPPDLDKQVLKALIIKKLILDKGTAADRAKAMDQFKLSMERYRTNGNMTEEQFNERLKQELKVLGQTRGQWETQNIERALISATVEREMGIKVTDDEVKKYYDDNPTRFEQAESVRVSHILLAIQDPTSGAPVSDEKKQAKRKQIDDLLKRARAGEDFTKLADQYSEDPGVKMNHGEYKFTRTDPYVQEFKDTAFALTNNQVSDVVTTQFGYHILKLSEKTPAKKVEFDKVKEDLKQFLVQQAMQKQFESFAAKLQKDANVQILDPSLKMDESPAEGAVPPPGAPPGK